MIDGSDAAADDRIAPVSGAPPSQLPLTDQEPF